MTNKINLDTTDQIFSTLVLLKGSQQRRLVITVENLHRHYGTTNYMVEGHRIDNGQWYCVSNVPAADLDKGVYYEY